MKLPITAINPQGKEIQFLIRIVYIDAGKYKRIVATILSSQEPLLWQIQDEAIGYIYNDTYTFSVYTFERQKKFPFKVAMTNHFAEPVDCYYFQIPVSKGALKDKVSEVS